MKIKDYSPITWVLERLFWLLQFLPPQILMSCAVGSRSKLPNSQIEDPAETAARAKKVEMFIIGYLVLDGFAFALTFSVNEWLIFLGSLWAILRSVDIVQATVNVTLFDRLRGRADGKVASKSRLVVLGFINFLELILCFAIIYASHLNCLEGATTAWDAVYFSVVTQLTIGYGDIKPLGIFRAVTVVQGLAGLSFLVLVFVRAISALPQIEEIFKPEQNDDA